MKDNPIGAIAGVDSYINGDYYNNTNASGYINSKRIAQRRRELRMEQMNDSTGEVATKTHHQRITLIKIYGK